jgi:hypothetical protein
VTYRRYRRYERAVLLALVLPLILLAVYANGLAFKIPTTVIASVAILLCLTDLVARRRLARDDD